MRSLLVVMVLVAPVVAAPNAGLIDQVMATWAHDDSPGCAVGVVQQKKLTFARGYGMADLEHHIPITADTVFDIASMSKQFTATAVAMLAADGKLSLDDDIRKHIPALPALGKITLRDMLHHTSGLRDYVALLELAGHEVVDVTSPEQAMELLEHQRGLDFAPGTKWSYDARRSRALGRRLRRAPRGRARGAARARQAHPAEDVITLPTPTPPPPVPIVVPKDLALYTGRFHSDELDVDWTFRVEAGELVVHGSGSDGRVHWSGRDAVDITPWDLAIRFLRGRKGISGFRVDSGAIRDLEFNRR